VVVVRAVWQERDETQRCTACPVKKKKTILESKTFKRTYLIGSVIVWVSILIDAVIVLRSGSHKNADPFQVVAVEEKAQANIMHNKRF
jgi:hypothetical protein